ncbi:MAG TPA: formate dehydrogenase accessory sulfurtransferase FdhD [Nitrospiraceae bacterium]|nr:MAG: formate dehydrogenase family accessory protein FdhD [Nitrospirae bacterium GWA2_46_11]HAK88827.1 formate dehydrogenase accessory sulfurtransferase FdhD [Nitrospiraceae bacterium]HCZ12596.1 formate dehydrogenase accessory sulfurtransferase FdhD [Nitrospiraceae bacterium]
MESFIKRKICKSASGSLEEREDLIAVEKRLRVSVNGKEVLSLYCTPLMVRELVVGMFMTEDIIKGGWCAERMSVQYGEDVTVDIPAEGEVSTEGAVITSGCIGGITFPKRMSLRKIEDSFTVKAEDLKGVFRTFQNASELYKSTGCVHSAGLSDGHEILCLAEDIGRHNAVDKIIGYAILEKIPFEGKIMLASGRLSSEIVSKCAKWGIPMVASRTSPTSLAVDIAEKSGVTVVGFIRADRLNVYTHPQRII